MAERFYVEPPLVGQWAMVEGPEAHHLIHVMRAKPGARVVLFDGSGAEFEAEVRRLGRTDVELAVLARHEVDRELPVRVVLGVALPKGERQKWLVEKAVELGVAEIVPLTTERCVVQPNAETLARLRRTVIEASKQCGRNRLAEISPPQSGSAFWDAVGGGACRWLAHPSAHDARSAPGQPGPALEAPGSGPIALAVGPEGGFTDEEVRQAQSVGWARIDLGSRILRIETAALLLVTWATRNLP
jgi:16S rRNA (uracil1498-N3)-methyltransferase